MTTTTSSTESVPVPSINFDELEWVELRRELNQNQIIDLERLYPSYKYNYYLPAAMVGTVGCFCYGLYHMDCPRRSVRGAYGRIASQFITAVLFICGFNRHMQNERIKNRKERELKAASKQQYPVN